MFVSPIKFSNMAVFYRNDVTAHVHQMKLTEN